VAKERRIGMHVHTGRGLDKAVDTIKALQLQAVQIFTGNPSAWRSAPVDPQATAMFKRSLEELDVRPAMAHAMYLINLASPNPTFQKKSRAALAAELTRAEAYGLQYVVSHVGSHMGDGAQLGIDRVVATLDQVLSTASAPAEGLMSVQASRTWRRFSAGCHNMPSGSASSSIPPTPTHPAMTSPARRGCAPLLISSPASSRRSGSAPATATTPPLPWAARLTGT
jgi:hypothetical protein